MRHARKLQRSERKKMQHLAFIKSKGLKQITYKVTITQSAILKGLQQTHPSE